MQRSDPVPDNKTCSQCDQPLVWHSTGAKHNEPADVEAEGLFRCPDDHELWAYAPASKMWTRLTEGLPSVPVFCPKGHGIRLSVRSAESVAALLSGSGQYWCKPCDQLWPMTPDQRALVERGVEKAKRDA